MSAQARSQLLRVSRRRPCPICGKPDWCSISGDGDIAVCMRKRSDHPARNGGWTHILSSGAHSPPVRPQPTGRKTTPVAERADSERRHVVYTALLDALELSEVHREDLLRRGLSPAEIPRLHYKSTPSSGAATEIARTLSRQFDLRGVPGFYQRSGAWRAAWMPPGYVVPYRDEQGRMQALQIRRCPYDGTDKYIWFSSNPDLMDEQGRQKYPCGTSSNAPLHYTRPDLLRDSHEVWLTEGALKAEIASFLLGGAAIIAAAGVTHFPQNFPASLKAQYPKLKTTIVVFDNDWWVKPPVKAAHQRLRSALAQAGFQVITRTWPTNFKGIDDYLLSLHREGRTAQ